MIITDLALLSDLHELDNSRVLEYLKELREEAVKESINVSGDRDCNIAVGKIRALDNLIDSITTAYDTAMKLKGKQSQKAAVDMKKAF